MSFGVQVFPSSLAYSIDICKQRLDLILGHVAHEGIHVGSCENLLKSVKTILAGFKSEGVGLTQTNMGIMCLICFYRAL